MGKNKAIFVKKRKGFFDTMRPWEGMNADREEYSLRNDTGLLFRKTKGLRWEKGIMKEEFKQIARDLVEKMSVEEAASQLRYDSPAIERLGIKAYNWWNEGLHGLARAGTATVFPQAIALASMFDTKLLEEIADVIATETRAKYNESRKYDDRDIYKGITLWSPNINIFRDARWGRGQETFGEDPYLTSRLGVAFIKGIQGKGKYLKCSACAKHYAVHSGPEALRHGFDAKVSQKDIEETYVPAFRAAIEDADVSGVMGAYNRVNGEAACASKEFIEGRLLKRWKFDGYFVSDFLALKDIHENHKLTEDSVHSAALALNNGCDLNAGVTYRDLMKAYEQGLVSEERIRDAAVKVLTIRAALGMFSDDCEYDRIDLAMSDTDGSNELAYRAAVRSTVLLKNDGFLPVNREEIKSVAVIGPTACSQAVLEGNYNGVSSRYVTNLEGVRAGVKPGTRVYYSEGCHLFENRVQNLAAEDDRLSEAQAVAEASDMVIMYVGLDSTIEGEEGDTGNAFAAGDKTSLLLPEPQRRLFDRVAKTGKPIVLVVNTGSAMDLSHEEESCRAILQSWYPGQAGGRAIADIIFGQASPGGRLPVTFYRDGTQPPIEDYSMKGRTYRYHKSEPLYPFGFGLSYSRFEYSDMTVQPLQEGPALCRVSVKVKNVGAFAADDVVQVYIDKLPGEKLENGLNNDMKDLAELLLPDNQPVWSLAGFERVSLEPGAEETVTLEISGLSFETVLENGSRPVLAGQYRIYAGGHQPDKRSAVLAGNECLSCDLKVEKQ